MARQISLVVLVSGRGSNLEAIAQAILEGRLSASISRVISNNPAAEGLEKAIRLDIPVQVIDHREYNRREEFDAALAQSIDDAAPDYIVLAGFMRILTPGFVARYRGRLINIHPSLLPALPGLDTHRRALDAGLSEHGVSVHFVTEEVDGGPVIGRARVPIKSGDSPELLAQRVLQQEHLLYPAVLQLLAEQDIRPEAGGLQVDGQKKRCLLDLAGEG